ncbi:MAG: hypothetical protein OXN97_09615 [Bryobacterales bacterium]|nr:hypothetical protein [Bryobacterales bacterium]
MKKALTVMGIIASSLGAVALFLDNVEKVVDSFESLADWLGISKPAYELELVCKDEVSFDQWRKTRFTLVGFNCTGDDLQVRIEYGFGDDPEAGSFSVEGPVLRGSATRQWQTITVPTGQDFEKSVRLPRLELLSVPEIDPVDVEIHWELHSINDKKLLETGDHLISIRGPYD